MSAKDKLHGGGYEVGYGKPPMHSRFKKGNQFARRRKAAPAPDTDLSTTVDRLLRRQVAITIDGRRQKMPLGEALIQKLLADAARGDHRARAQVFKLEELRMRLASTPDPVTEAHAQPLDAAQQDVVERYKAGLREEIRREISAQAQGPVPPSAPAAAPPGLAPVRIRRRPQ